MNPSTRILIGDAIKRLRELPDASVHCCVTSPPYWGLRDYGVEGQIGLEPTPEAWILRLVDVFREVRRVLRPDGTLWLNVGDCYASGSARCEEGFNARWHGKPFLTNKQGHTDRVRPARKPLALPGKNLVGLPWRLAFALQADGWFLRSDIIWHKPNPMPESVTDRPTKAHEYIFLLSKNARYFYDNMAMRTKALTDKVVVRTGRQIRSPERKTLGLTSATAGTNRTGAHPAGKAQRDVWSIPSLPFPDAHFATFPPKLVEPCVKAGCPEGGTVLDPFLGAGTTALVANGLGRDCIGIELSPEYAAMAEQRMMKTRGLFANISFQPAAGER